MISGEEEAIYGWTAVNFVKGSLILNSEGTGTVSRANKTFGLLEMGGASAQIGFYEPDGDVMANLFKLQLGAAKHWNVYAHSFLYFGVNGAYDRLNARLFAVSPRKKGEDIYNPCLPGGSQYLFTSRVQMEADGTLLPMSSPQDPSILEADMYSAVMGNTNKGGDFHECYAQTILLMRKEANSWCDFAHDRDCSFAGIYQPPLPVRDKDFGEFIATSNFVDVWEFLELQPRSSLLQVKDAAHRICSFSLDDLLSHNDQLNSPISDLDELKSMCFRASFVTSFLIHGVGFPEDYNVTALDVVNGQKVGWALGSMLYEINTLPWEFKKNYLHKLKGLDLMGAARSFDAEDDAGSLLGLLLGLVLVVGFVYSGFKQLVTRRRARHSVFAEKSETAVLIRPQSDYGARKG